MLSSDPLTDVDELAKALMRDETPEQRHVNTLDALLEIAGSSTYDDNTDEANRDILDTIYELAGELVDEGRGEEGQKIYERVLPSYEKVYGPDYPTFSLLEKLGRGYQSQERWEEARATYERVVRGYDTMANPSWGTTLLNNLGLVYQKLGRWEDAEAMHMRELERWSKGYRLRTGEIEKMIRECPGTVLTMEYLAGVYSHREEWEAAEMLQAPLWAYWKRVEDEYRKLIDKETYEKRPPSRGMLELAANLSFTYCNLGRWDKAESLQVFLVEGRKKGPGELHADTLTSMVDLACIWRELERLGEAVELLEACVRNSGRVLGDTHRDTLYCAAKLAEWKQAAGQA